MVGFSVSYRRALVKQAERDDLLIRLDEKMNNIWRVVEQVENHQTEQNGLIRESFDQIASNSRQTSRNSTWIIAIRWIIGGICTALAMGLTHLNGLW